MLIKISIKNEKLIILKKILKSTMMALKCFFSLFLYLFLYLTRTKGIYVQKMLLFIYFFSLFLNYLRFVTCNKKKKQKINRLLMCAAIECLTVFYFNKSIFLSSSSLT